MTQLSVQEAAQRVGVVRQTIFKKIKEGKLSATQNARGVMQIDITELLRVFGRLHAPEDNSEDMKGDKKSPGMSSTTSMLQLELERAKMQLQLKDKELEFARERIDELKARELDAKSREREAVEERLRLVGVIEQQNRLLAAPVPVPPPAPKPAPRAARAPAKTPAPVARKAQAKPLTKVKPSTVTKPAAAKKAPAKSKTVAKPAKKTTRR